MATYYIDPLNGVDGAAGTLGAPKKTQKGFDTAPAITLANSDRIGIMNTGSLDIGTSANTYTINKNVTIFGCDVSGNPANATLTSGANTVRRHITATAGAVITFDNIIFDFSSRTADANVVDIVWYNGSTGKMTWRGCKLKASALGGGTAPAARRALQNMQSNPGTAVAVADFQYCYFENATSFGFWNAVNNESLDHCVFIDDLASVVGFSKNCNASGLGFTYTNCTSYTVIGASVVGAPLNLSSLSGTLAVTIHSNLLYKDSTLAGTLIGFVRDGSGLGTISGTIGYNGLFTGPNVLVSELYTNGWYEKKFDPDANDATGSDTYATDVVAYGVTATNLFSNPSGTYNWSTVNGLTLTLPKDLRPLLYQTSSLSGGVLGALPGATTDIAVSASADVLNPDIDENVTFTVTVTNTGNIASSVVATVTIPSGLTLVSSVATDGTYVGSTWAIGTMTSSDTATLTIVASVDDDTAGEDLVFTAVYTSSDIADSNSANNSATIIISVLEDTGDVTDPGGGGIPYLDTLPIFTITLGRTLNIGIRTRTNRVQTDYHRFDEENEHYREVSQKLIILGTSVTQTINMGGIQRGRFIMIESDIAVRMSVANQSTRFWPASTFLVLSGGEFEVVKINNPSATAQATVKITVTD